MAFSDIVRGTGGALSGESSDIHRVLKELEAFARPIEQITNPGVTDDISKGYQVGQRWINTATDDIYTCTDNSLGAADWAIDSATASTWPMTNWVVVESKSDLPTPSGGAITLAANTVYLFNGATNLGTDHLAITGASTYLLAEFGDRDSITYTGVGGAIRVSGGVDFKLTGLGIIAFAGTAFTCTDAPFALIQRMSFIGNKVGTFTDCAQVAFTTSTFINVDSGINFLHSGTATNVVLRENNFLQGVGGTGTLLDFGTMVSDFIESTSNFFTSVAGGTDVSGLASSGNLTPTTGRGVVHSSRLNGTGTHLVGIDPDSILWDFVNTTGVPDSHNIGSLTMSANATTTAIGIQGTMTKVLGTTVLGEQRRFDDNGGTSNLLRYTGTDPVTVLAMATATIEKTGGTQESGSLQFFKNSIAEGPPVSFIVNNQPRGAVVSIPINLVTGDIVELYVTNNDSTTSITVVDLVMHTGAY